MSTTYLSFDTGRLHIRPTDESDAAFLLELLNTPKWLAFIGDRKVYSLEDASRYVQEKMRPQLERLGFSSYTILRRQDGARIGCCGLYDREGVEGVDIGFALLPAYEGMGYAFEASSRIQRAAWEDFRLPEISAITVRENVSSQRLLEKLGLSYVREVRLPNDDTDLLLYRIRNPQLLSTS